MKKEIPFNGIMALLILCGLVALRLQPGQSHSFFSYATDASIAVVLLGFGDQILLTGLYFFVQMGKKVKILFRAMAFYKNWPIRNRQGVAASKKGMTKEAHLHPLLMALLLICAGLLSPSDGVDSGRYLPASELLIRALIILAAGAGFFLVSILLGWQKQGDVKIPGSQKGNLPEADGKQSTVFETME